MSLLVCKILFVYSFMKMNKDPYSILGIPPGSTETDIKKAYKDLIRQHHPDKGGSEEKCKEINQAYNQLMNPEERAWVWAWAWAWVWAWE
jgi:curved DNA-binding protein CbpA